MLNIIVYEEKNEHVLMICKDCTIYIVFEQKTDHVIIMLTGEKECCPKYLYAVSPKSFIGSISSDLNACNTSQSSKAGQLDKDRKSSEKTA